MLKIYLVPIEQNGPNRGPEYFVWRNDANPPSVSCRWSWMDYGFTNYGLLVAHDITQADHDTVSAKPDVYTFPDNLDQPINDKAAIDAYFETINLPTDWTTPSTTYRELLRQVAGLMQFNQRYGGISGQSIFANGVTLETNYNQLSAQQRAWFEQTLVSFGWLQGVQGNPKMRSLAKQAGDLWGNAPFYMSEYVI